MIPELPPSAAMFQRMADEHKLTMSVAEFRRLCEMIYQDGISDCPVCGDNSGEMTPWGASMSRRLVERAIDLWAVREPTHIHVDAMNGTDTCAKCGRDLRDEIHERSIR